MVHSYRDLFVWQKSMILVGKIYKTTQYFPHEEKFGLISQLRRSSISIPSNIAEGHYRSSRKDYHRFLRIAYGSGAELETQIEIAKRLQIISVEKAKDISRLLEEVMKMLNRLIKKISKSNTITIT